MNVIVPCCGESTRFKGLKKQFLTHPMGLPLPLYSVSGLKLKSNDIVTFVFLRDEFIDRYSSEKDFRKHAEKINLPIQLELLDTQTINQIHTVRAGIRDIDEAIYVKDCDNYFETTPLPNSVAVIHTTNFTGDTSNKSFSRGNPITQIKERVGISPFINVGGYGFKSARIFIDFCDNKNYVSQIIQEAVDNLQEFRLDEVEVYEDYGTLTDWLNYLKKFE